MLYILKDLRSVIKVFV